MTGGCTPRTVERGSVLQPWLWRAELTCSCDSHIHQLDLFPQAGSGRAVRTEQREVTCPAVTGELSLFPRA